MFVGIARYDLRIPEAASLKDKRAVLRRLLAILRQKFNVSVGEVDHLDLWQRATLGLALVTDTPYHARRVLQEISRHVETHPGVELLSVDTEMVSPDD
jgi:uncharacterized protein YlxP (DUF503 family)